MGTGNLTMVVSNGETKIAQFGQWDGHPEDQGVDILNILRSVDLNILKEKVGLLRWLTPEEYEQLNQTDWKRDHPYLSRDIGARILGIVYNGKLFKTEPDIKIIESDIKIWGLINYENFASDRLCEWGYVIDLDNNVFEVYKGFNKSPLKEDDRFYGLPKDGYYPIKEVARFYLSDLPSDEVFLNYFKNKKKSNFPMPND